MLYDRTGSLSIFSLGGLARQMPVYSFFFTFFSVANLGFPGTAGFSSEILMLTGIYSENPFIAFLIFFGLIISGIVSVWTNNRVLFGGNNAKYNNVYLHKKIIHKYRTCEANEAGTFLDYVNTYVGKYGFYEKSKPVVYTESISKTQP